MFEKEGLIKRVKKGGLGDREYEGKGRREGGQGRKDGKTREERGGKKRRGENRGKRGEEKKGEMKKQR